MKYSRQRYNNIQTILSNNDPWINRQLLVYVYIHSTPIDICSQLFDMDSKDIYSLLKEENVLGYKICSKCEQLLPFDMFYSNSSMKGQTKLGLSCHCRNCVKNNGKRYYQNNHDKKMTYSREYKRREYVKIKVKEYAKKYYSDPEIKLKLAKDANDRYHNDPEVKIRRIISVCLNKGLKNTKNFRKTETLLGYSISELKISLEKQFESNMSWDNHGSVWEIDHIIPISCFDLTRLDHIQNCWSLKNLRPLYKILNRQKHNKIINQDLYNELVIP